MRRRYLFLVLGGLSMLLLTFLSSKTCASPHAACPISRIAYIPSSIDQADAEAIYIGHTHITNAPEKSKNQSLHFRLRGVHRNFTLACHQSALLKTTPVDAASLTAPPLYNSPDCASPQHNYLFLLTPF